MKIKPLSLILCTVIASVSLLTGCKGEPSSNALAENIMNQDSAATQSSEPGTVRNFEMPAQGEKIAVITVKDYGEIKIKLFPDAAEKAVENFVGLAEMGYYDELIFHRIIPNFMNQGGDPRGNGTGGNSIWGESFDGGIPEGLYHFTGAIAYANSGSTATNGSQFYIVNTPDGYLQNTCEELMAYDPNQYNWPQNVVDLYNEKGGVPFLDGGYTVFGQVFEGIDVVRAMSAVETDDNDKPLKQVQIESVKIVEYQG